MSGEVDAEIEALIGGVVKILAPFADAPARGKAMTDTTSAPSVLTNERLAILAVNTTEANNALGKEVRAMALELQSRRASDPIRAELLEALKRMLSVFDVAYHHDGLLGAEQETCKIARAAITRAEME